MENDWCKNLPCCRFVYNPFCLSESTLPISINIADNARATCEIQGGPVGHIHEDRSSVLTITQGRMPSPHHVAPWSHPTPSPLQPYWPSGNTPNSGLHPGLDLCSLRYPQSLLPIYSRLCSKFTLWERASPVLLFKRWSLSSLSSPLLCSFFLLVLLPLDRYFFIMTSN